MPKPKNKEQRELIHVAIPLEYHTKFKAHVSKSGSDITKTVNTLIENYLIENNLIQKTLDKSIIVDA